MSAPASSDACFWHVEHLSLIEHGGVAFQQSQFTCHPNLIPDMADIPHSFIFFIVGAIPNPSPECVIVVVHRANAKFPFCTTCCS